MLDTTSTKFSHIREEDTTFEEGGLRDFFLYRDLGVRDATNGKVVAHLVKANPDLPPEKGTGWHRHVLEIVGPADFGTVDVPPVCDVPDPTPWPAS